MTNVHGTACCFDCTTAPGWVLPTAITLAILALPVVFTVLPRPDGTFWWERDD